MTDDTTRPDGEPEPTSAAWRDYAYHIATTGAALLLLLGTVVYRYAEDWSWVDSIYFCTVAVTTVGFGDLAPTTDGTKLFTIFYVFTGISLFGLILDERLRRHARDKAGRLQPRARRRSD